MNLYVKEFEEFYQQIKILHSKNREISKTASLQEEEYLIYIEKLKSSFQKMINNDYINNINHLIENKELDLNLYKKYLKIINNKIKGKKQNYEKIYILHNCSFDN